MKNRLVKLVTKFVIRKITQGWRKINNKKWVINKISKPHNQFLYIIIIGILKYGTKLKERDWRGKIR